MQPNLIIDKSGLEPLSVPESRLLDCYFRVVVPPIFTLEVVGNLAQRPEERPARQKGTAEGRVSAFANKLGLDADVTADYREICVATLLGVEFSGNRACIPYSTHDAFSSQGHRGIIIEESAIESAVDRWRRRDFTAEDHEASEYRRAADKRFDVEPYLRLFHKHRLEIPKPKSFDEIGPSLTYILNRRRLQYELLALLMDQVAVAEPARQAINRRWKALPHHLRYLSSLSEYATHCMRANLALVIATEGGLVNHDETSRSDIEYCYYLPNCEVFVSGDRLHRRIQSLLLEPDQLFLAASDLKEDLKRRVDLGLTEEQEYRGGPTELSGSVINTVHAKVNVVRSKARVTLNPAVRNSAPRFPQLPGERPGEYLMRLARDFDEGRASRGGRHAATGEPLMVRKSRLVRLEDIERRFGKEAVRRILENEDNES